MHNLLAEGENVTIQYERGEKHCGTSHRPIVEQALIELPTEIPEGHGKKFDGRHGTLHVTAQ
jgi:hypothetical protein